jgi:hypothetical protein
LNVFEKQVNLKERYIRSLITKEKKRRRVIARGSSTMIVDLLRRYTLLLHS